jgi:hypothetical protein
VDEFREILSEIRRKLRKLSLGKPPLLCRHEEHLDQVASRPALFLDVSLELVVREQRPSPSPVFVTVDITTVTVMQSVNCRMVVSEAACRPLTLEYSLPCLPAGRLRK